MWRGAGWQGICTETCSRLQLTSVLFAPITYDLDFNSIVTIIQTVSVDCQIKVKPQSIIMTAGEEVQYDRQTYLQVRH